MDLKTISVQLSSVLNACGIVLPLVNLRQKTIKYGDTIWNILQSIERNNPEEKAVGSTAEGLDLTSCDIDFISVVDSKTDYPEEVSIHGPPLNTRYYPPKDTYSLPHEAGNATDIIIAISVVDINTDFVACLRGEQWPVEVSEWKTRRRSAKWRSQHLFDDIIKSGYYLAGVGSKESKDNEIQWRVPFNKAEQLIVESLNKTQIHCIIILKIFRARLLSDITGNITSYTIKTILLMKDKQTSAYTKDSDNRRKYTNYMELSTAGEVTNTNLRIATCYLDDGVTDDCFKIIRTVTDNNNLVKVNYDQHVIQTLNRTITAFQNMAPSCKDIEIEMYKRIISKYLTDQDPYNTIEEFEIMRKQEIMLVGTKYSIFLEAVLVLKLCNDNS
ncbi:unnamed protein product [Mytilus coruscus]|uniref:Mab-21-like nucleotidyltransferase domain-containing protein n=1 Tax=Mytilus coruscus TaxID=42192 RepID=A0A6J7ZUQ5_MYTCO|nr:unnamed protein product [Mytilus coruscus]